MSKLTQAERDEIRRRAQETVDGFRRSRARIPDRVEVLWGGSQVVDLVEATKQAIQGGLSQQQFAESLRDDFSGVARVYWCPVRHMSNGDVLADYPIEK